MLNSLGQDGPGGSRRHVRTGCGSGPCFSGKSVPGGEIGGRTGHFLVETSLSYSTSNQRGGAVRQFTRAVVQFVKREDGPTAVEYAIMLALIVTICIGVITTIGSNGNVLSANAPAASAIGISGN